MLELTQLVMRTTPLSSLEAGGGGAGVVQGQGVRKKVEKER